MSTTPTGRNRLRATAHPVRLEMLSLLTGAEMSAAEVARELGLTQANASYHLRLLLGAGLLVVAGEEKVNGGLAKRYRHLWNQPQPEEPPPGQADAAYVEAEVNTMVDAVPRRFAQRIPGVPGHFTDADLWVQPAVWDEVLALLLQASSVLHDNARPPRADGTVRANLSIMAFRMQETRTGEAKAPQTRTGQNGEPTQLARRPARTPVRVVLHRPVGLDGRVRDGPGGPRVRGPAPD